MAKGDDEFSEEWSDTAHTQPPRPPGEGVRIIGAEEASAVLESGQAESRRPSDGSRFGDVPPLPSGPRPALRFPLEDDEPGPAEPPAPAGHDLPHWTEPATGEVPRILGGEAESPGPDDPSWSSFTRAPRWRDQGGDWDEAEFGDASVLADSETRLGALDTTRTEHSDLFSFDEPIEEPAAPPPTRIMTRSDRLPGDAVPIVRPAGPRDNGTAVAIGAALALVFLLLAKAGPRFLLVYVSVIVLLCTAEVYAALRRTGFKPATLLGMVATLSLLVGSYWKGERALPLVVVLTVVFSMLWYLAGVMAGRPTANVAATIMGFCWAGFLGSYAALILRPGSYVFHHRDGVAVLLGAVLCTVANDVGAYGFGRTFGRTPLAPSISPGKTLEGYLGGMLCTVLLGTGLVSRLHPFSVSKGFWLGVVVALVAPLGDLCESLIKRDIGVKDMGSLLPGHGGVMDRFDALLFVLPATYYLAQVSHLFTRR